MAQITRRDLGAWLVRCNPRVWDLETYVSEGNGPIRSWSVSDNYRSRMMRRNDRVLLWVAGQSHTYERGIWGYGLVTGDTRFNTIPEGEGSHSYWRSEATERKHTNFCQVKISIRLDNPVTDRVLRAAGVSDLEVQRQPQGSNPSWVTQEQLAQIDALLQQQPDPIEALAGANGGRFGSPTENQKVEHAAMVAVTNHYAASGWAVEDVSLTKVGWDLTCTNGDEIACVEVKGVRGTRPIVFLTANELRAAREEHGWVLAVVTEALGRPTLVEFTGAHAQAAALPYVYRANLELLANIDQ